MYTNFVQWARVMKWPVEARYSRVKKSFKSRLSNYIINMHSTNFSERIVRKLQLTVKSLAFSKCLLKNTKRNRMQLKKHKLYAMTHRRSRHPRRKMPPWKSLSKLWRIKRKNLSHQMNVFDLVSDKFPMFENKI